MTDNPKRTNESYKARQLKKLLGLKKQAQKVQSALLEISELASHCFDKEHYYLQLHEVIASVVKAPNLFILFKSSITKNYDIHYYATQEGTCDKPDLPDNVIDVGLTGYMLRSRQSLLCNSADYTKLIDDGEIIELGEPAVSWLGVPLSLTNGDIGALVVVSYQQSLTFTQEDKAVLELLAEHISHSIEHMQRQALMEREINSRTRALHQVNQKLKLEIAQQQRFQTAQKNLLELSEEFNFSNEKSSLFQSFSLIANQVFELPNYIAEYDSHTKKWSYLGVSAIEDISELQTYQCLNEYIALDAQPMVLTHKEIKHLVAFGAIVADEQQKLSLNSNIWLVTPLQAETDKCLLLVIFKSEHEQEFSEKDTDLANFLAMHFNLIAHRWQSQQSMLQAQDQLEDTVNQRTQALNEANHDLQQQIEERIKVQEKLYYDANHDLLTGLPNRQLFNRKLMHAVACATMDKSHEYKVLFIDLDRFKLINDTFGHLTGDRFLVEVSDRISACLTDGEVLARLGGDEFVILMLQDASLKRAQHLANNIISSLNNSFDIDGNEIYAGCSIGITGSEQNYNKPADVLRDADTAMYQAKHKGRGRYVLFDQSLHTKLINQLNQESELRRALKEGALEFVFQPVVNLSTNEVAAVEALVRWQHPTQGMLKPADFLGMAYDTGLILQIDQQAVAHACEYLTHRNISKDKALISVNVSSRSLCDESAFSQLLETLSGIGDAVQGLILEFTERGINDIEQCVDCFETLRNLGVRIALDDFGAGVASLALLYSGELDFVKVDAKLIHLAEDDLAQRRFAASIVAIGHEQGFIVIAEGIETDLMKETAENMGCLFAQGRLLAEAVSSDEFYRHLLTDMAAEQVTLTNRAS
ncbi:EAL domain-containing protein [Catenovulum agarivorans]|uniref:sensor domain-containing phosphodiesterase n=1 Tax=Catenovulum agarivorans TaxID=1172192 RepID=UPI000379E9CF|nr:EAL domain-containing protein [Catenovulum agarivorans]